AALLGYPACAAVSVTISGKQSAGMSKQPRRVILSSLTWAAAMRGAAPSNCQFFCEIVGRMRGTAQARSAEKSSSRSNTLRTALPSRDLVDDGAVVEIRFAHAHTCLQHVAMHVEHGQGLPMTLGLLQHQVHVLERLSHTAFRGEVAIEHLCALHVHDLRI